MMISKLDRYEVHCGKQNEIVGHKMRKKNTTICFRPREIGGLLPTSMKHLATQKSRSDFSRPKDETFVRGLIVPDYFFYGEVGFQTGFGID